MKKIALGVALLMTAFASPANAQGHDFHIQYTYFNADGSFAGRFTVFCNGFEEIEGNFTNNFTVVFGPCNAM